MGRRITQRILQCADCQRIPDDGEYMWEMPGGYLCEECYNKNLPPEIPGFEGTREALSNLKL